MKNFNKWMVVPFEENKVLPPDSDQVDEMKKILKNNNMVESQKYDEYNKAFRNYINKKSSKIEDESEATSFSIDKIKEEDISEKFAIGEANLNKVDQENKSKINSIKNFFQKKTDTYQTELDSLQNILMDIIQNKSDLNLSPYRSLTKNTRVQKKKRVLDASALASTQKIVEAKKLKTVKQKKLELELEKKNLEVENQMKKKNLVVEDPMKIKNVQVVNPIKWQHNDQSMTEVN